MSEVIAGALAFIVIGLWWAVILDSIVRAWVTGVIRTGIFGYGDVDSRRIDGTWYMTDKNGEPIVIDLGPDFDTDDDPVTYEALIGSLFD
jgi:hypothetical protein